jgi:seryl-tRNA synthetase
MLTTRYVKENIDAIRKSLEKRKSLYPLDELLGLDEKAKKIAKELQELRARRNKGSLEISEMKKAKKNAEAKMAEMSEIKAKIDKLEAELPQFENRIEFMLANMPNILHESVPYGMDESGNIELRKHGNAKRREMPGHEEVLTKLDLLDIENAARVSGARFYYLKGDLAMLEQSIIRFALDELVKKGYTAVAPPMMLKREYYKGVTSFGDFEDVLYKVVDPKEIDEGRELERIADELYLIATSEHAVASMYSDHVFSARDLPKRFVAVSPCFRREAGAHGKDTKGIFRVHQFYKVEQFVFSKDNSSWKIFDELVANSEDLLKKLGIPYRAVNICTGDIGTVAAKKIDLEAYMPGQDKYREMVSCSNCTDWQAMRLNIRYDEGNERKYVHTLNSTAIATERAIVAIVENYYNDDGTITVPEALVPYMGKSKIA